MDKDDYTLMSSKEVSELKQDVDYLKKNPLGGTKAGRSLQDSIDKLNDNMNMLIEVFKEAADQLKMEEHEEKHLLKRIEPIEDKLNELSDQNEKIAKGILAVADMVSAKQQQKPASGFPSIKPLPKPMPRPMSRPMPKLPPMGSVPASLGGAPPPLPTMLPPKKEEKKGFFGKLLKK